MTWAELLKKLNQLPVSILEERDVAIYDAERDEYFFLTCLQSQDEDDVLDKDSPYLAFGGINKDDSIL